MRLAELREVLDLTDALAAAAEAGGCRPVLSVRNAAQLQSRAFLDSLHSRTLKQLTGTLRTVVRPAGVQIHPL